MAEITIKGVEGNPLNINVVMNEILHHLSDGVMETETVDFYPDTTKPVRAYLDCTTARKQFCPTTYVDGNIVYLSCDNATAGVYTLTVTCTDTNGKARRYKSDACIEVYDLTSAAEIAGSFDEQTYEMNGVFYTSMVQSDWDEVNPASPAYILNKPDLTEYATKEDIETIEGEIPVIPEWAQQPQKPSYTAGEVGAVPTSRTVNGKALSEDITLNAQDVGAQTPIADLAQIREGAAKGATAYQKPSNGMPKTDLAVGVQQSLDKANTAYQKPSAGIPKTDLAQEIQQRLDIPIDDEPTAGSNNLVKSGGVYNELVLGAVYDVSSKNPTAGPNNDGKWEALSALLSDANLYTIIPTSVRKGGMSIKFVQSSDNKYVQYRYMGTAVTGNPNPFIDIANWQGVDEVSTPFSKNLMESGEVAKIIFNIENQLSEPIRMSSGYIKCNGAVGSEVDLTVQTHDTYTHALINCAEGDIFYIQGKGGYSDRLYCFIDEDNEVVSKAPQYTENSTPQKVIAPATSAKLIINDEATGRVSWKGVRAVPAIEVKENVSTGKREMTIEKEVVLEVEKDVEPGSNDVVESRGVSKALSEMIPAKYTTINPTATSDNYELIGNGLCQSNSNARMKKYSVVAGTIIKLNLNKETLAVYQWQNDADVPLSGTNSHLIGSPIVYESKGFVRVPDGATYLITSEMKSNTTNYVATVHNGVDESPTHNSKNLITSGAVYEVKSQLQQKDAQLEEGLDEVTDYVEGGSTTEQLTADMNSCKMRIDRSNPALFSQSTSYDCARYKLLAGHIYNVKISGGRGNQYNSLWAISTAALYDQSGTSDASGNVGETSAEIEINATERDIYLYIDIPVGDNTSTVVVTYKSSKGLLGDVEDLKQATPLLDTRDNMPILTENPLQFLKSGASSVCIFSDWGVIGQSNDAGTFIYTNGQGQLAYVSMYEQTWCQKMCKMNGVNGYEFAIGGITTKQWCTGVIDGHTVTNRTWLEAQQSDNLKKAYVVKLGGNDISKESYGVGDLSTDVDLSDYNNNADTYAGWIAGVIQRLRSVQPKCFIFVGTEPYDSSKTAGQLAVIEQYNDVMRDLPNYFEHVYVMDMYEYGFDWGSSYIKSVYFNGGHLNAMGQYIQALNFNTYIDWIIRNNYEDFVEAQFVGTDYHLVTN